MRAVRESEPVDKRAASESLRCGESSIVPRCDIRTRHRSQACITVKRMYNAFTTARIVALGIPKRALRTGLRCCLRRLAHGIYVVDRRCPAHPQFEVVIDDESFLRTRATAVEYPRNGTLRARVQCGEHLALLSTYAGFGCDDVISHRSAAVVRGLPLIEVPRGVVELSNPVRARTEKALRRRKRKVPAGDCTEWGRRLVTTAGRTALDLAANSVEDGMLAVDYVLSQLEPEDNGLAAFRRIAAADPVLSRSARVELVLGWATGIAESPGESLCLLRFRSLGFTDLEQQVWIVDENGRRIARVDFLLRSERVVIEVDGADKYRPTAAGGFDASGDAGLEEKKRQHRIEARGFRVVHLMWADIASPERFRRALARARVLV